MKRILSLILVCALSFSIILNVNAEQNTIPINANISGEFEVLLPTNIQMGNEVIEVPYFVRADLPGNSALQVAMRNNVELTDEFDNRVLAAVLNSKTKYNGGDIFNQVESSFKVSTKAVTAGTWVGNVDVVISVIKNEADGAGLYDSNGTLLADWNTLVNTYGLDVVSDYNVLTNAGHISNVITQFTDPSKLVIPGSVGRLGMCSLKNIILDTVEILEGVTTLGVGTFIDSTIDNLIFPESLTEIEGAVFQGGVFKNIIIPNTLVNFGEANLYYTTFDSITIDGVNPYYKIVNGIIYDLGGTKAFNLIDYSMTNAVIEEGTRDIAQMTFESVTSLKSVTIPESVVSIGDWAFAKTSITSLYIPKNVQIIGQAIAFDCNKLTSIIVDGESPYFCAVDNCIYTKDMKELVFVHSKKTGTLTIPEGVEVIREQAFKKSKLSQVILPESLKRIEGGAFDEAAITSINIPENVNYIGDLAFNKCSKLTDITIDSDNMFYTELGDVIMTKDMKEVIAVNPHATSIVIPEGVERIRAYGVAQTYATSITIPSTLKTIDSYGLCNNTKVASITIPDTIESIGYYAFLRVPKVYYKGSLTDVNNWGATQLITNY